MDNRCRHCNLVDQKYHGSVKISHIDMCYMVLENNGKP